MNKTKLHITVLLGIAVLFAGCAVLTVDVDVYKGPLANHEDIQTEQMAAMAIGAKPLLVQLRDTLEVEHEYWKKKEVEYKKSKKKINPFTKNLDTRLALLRERPWYRPK